MAAVALFLPVAAMGKLQPSIVASPPNTYNYTQRETCSTSGARRLQQ